jgi:hypothetical protein
MKRSANKCGTGDFGHRVGEIESCKKFSTAEEHRGNIDEI